MTPPLDEVSDLDRVSFDLAMLDLQVDTILNAMMDDAQADGDTATAGACWLAWLVRQGTFPAGSLLAVLSIALALLFAATALTGARAPAARAVVFDPNGVGNLGLALDA